MKKTILAAALLITIASCKKEKEDLVIPTIKKDYLTEKEWILVSKQNGDISQFTDSAKYDFNKNGVLFVDGIQNQYDRTENSITLYNESSEEGVVTYSIDKLNQKELIISEEFTLNFIAK